MRWWGQYGGRRGDPSDSGLTHSAAAIFQVVGILFFRTMRTSWPRVGPQPPRAPVGPLHSTATMFPLMGTTGLSGIGFITALSTWIARR